MGSFAGFTPETIDFLWGIRFQNNREWFQAHKQMYLQELYRPMQALAQEVLQPLARELDCVCKVSRIYKDARRKPERPYKESLWICLRRDAAWWGEEPSLFFELTPDASRCGFLLWGPKPAWMEGFRQTIAAHPAAFQALAAQVEPLEDVVDDLKIKLRNRHIERLKENKCTIELGFMFSDLLTNYERVSDHCSNIAVSLLTSAQDNMDVHAYLDEGRKLEPEYQDTYKAFQAEFGVE